jgi:large subunit ribosomal protein L33
MANCSAEASETKIWNRPLARRPDRGTNMAREQITLQCTECKRKNYTSMKNKKTTTERLELSKFCPFCRKHHPHKEIK